MFTRGPGIVLTQVRCWICRLISVDEIKDTLKEQDPNADVEAIIKEIDKDGNGEIDYQEFCEMMPSVSMVEIDCTASKLDTKR